MKNVKVLTRLFLGYISIDILLAIAIYMGYTSAQNILTVENTESYLRNYGIFTAVEFILMLCISTGIGISIMHTLKEAMTTLTKAADDLVLGKVDIQLEKTADNEFGKMIEDLQKVVDNVRYQAQIAQEVADGNLTIEVRPKSEEDAMGLALRKMVMQNQHAMGNIKDAAYQVTTSSSQVASASEALAQGSTEQASAIEQITASIDDIAEKTKQNASQANKAAELVGKTIIDVKKGNAEMKEMVNAMQDINKSSESISKIIKVIDDIAFQTNILALNAAVEAARAGEAGKGFAVVAEEVRNLAAKSAAAAAETAELIEDSIRKVEVGSSIANQTAAALEEISEVVKESEVIITDIASASNYQATAIAQVDQAIEQVSQVVQTNSATSEECAAASVELSNQAGRVREMLAVYRLNDGGRMSLDRRGDSESKYRSSIDKNEQIISLTDGFGKY